MFEEGVLAQSRFLFESVRACIHSRGEEDSYRRADCRCAFYRTTTRDDIQHLRWVAAEGHYISWIRVNESGCRGCG